MHPHSIQSGLTRLSRLTQRSLLAIGLLLPTAAFAGDFDSGYTAWMLTATALVLFMTIPGLSLFYAGLVRSKNVLSVLMQIFAITCMSTLVWVAVGYSLALNGTGAPGISLDNVPDDLCYYHSCAHRGWFCRADEILGDVVI